MSYSSYNGQTISYDESGNPTSYKGDTITWNGRLMTSYTKGNRRYEYSYNSDGMRTVKKIYENNELIYTYLYIWDGDVLLASRISTPTARNLHMSDISMTKAASFTAWITTAWDFLAS